MDSAGIWKVQEVLNATFLNQKDEYSNIQTVHGIYPAVGCVNEGFDHDLCKFYGHDVKDLWT